MQDVSAFGTKKSAMRLKFDKKLLTKQQACDIISKHYGGIAQLARAIGSYPIGRGFKSNSRYGPLVKRLRHRPFTAVTWVRFPYGSPNVTNPNSFVN